MIRAYDTAIDLVALIESREKSGHSFKYLTLLSSMVCFSAAVLVSRVIHSSYGQLVNTEKGRQTFSTCIYIFRQCSVEDNDMPGRVSKTLAQLWSIHQGLDKDCKQPPRLSLKTRMFFSIVQDSLWLWREIYGGQGAPSLPPPFMPGTHLGPSSSGLPLSPAASTTYSEPRRGVDPCLTSTPTLRADGQEMSMTWDLGLFDLSNMPFDMSLPDLDVAW
jgi:hypothetical protein